MARSPLNYGNSPNDGTGDTIRQAAIKIDNALKELYLRMGTTDENGTQPLHNTVAPAGPGFPVEPGRRGRIIQKHRPDDAPDEILIDDGEEWRLLLDSHASVGDLSDVDTSEIEDSQILHWDETEQKFTPHHGVILTSPDGTKFKLVVDDNGDLSTTPL